MYGSWWAYWMGNTSWDYILDNFISLIFTVVYYKGEGHMFFIFFVIFKFEKIETSGNYRSQEYKN